MVQLRVRVRPAAHSTAVVRWEDGVLHVSVSAPPHEGRANQAVAGLLAETLGVPKSCVQLLRGERGREKVFAILGVSEAELRERLTAFNS